jgi:hypothetical protein
MDVVTTELGRRVTNLGEKVKRRNWLIAILAALFVLQAPLCVLACLTNAAQDESTAEALHASPPPCHEQAPHTQAPHTQAPHTQAPTSAPDKPADTHNDCGCEDSFTAVLASADKTFTNVQTSQVIATKALEDPVGAVLRSTIDVRLSEADLPPPDILLLKSTLLI